LLAREDDPEPPLADRKAQRRREAADEMIRRGVHKSVQALEKDVRAWIETWN
jgi:hypothetical protein